MDTTNERWMHIDGCNESYSASTLGRIRSEPRTINNNGGAQYHAGRILKASPAKSHGYPTVNIMRHGKRAPFLVHRLVAETFIGKCPDGMECAHKDGNHLNAAIKNLEWKTHIGNEADKVSHQTICNGERVAHSKLTQPIVKLILNDQRTNSEIAKEIGVDTSLISRIKSRKLWRHVEP